MIDPSSDELTGGLTSKQAITQLRIDIEEYLDELEVILNLRFNIFKNVVFFSPS